MNLVNLVIYNLGQPRGQPKIGLVWVWTSGVSEVVGFEISNDTLIMHVRPVQDGDKIF